MAWTLNLVNDRYIFILHVCVIMCGTSTVCVTQCVAMCVVCVTMCVTVCVHTNIYTYVRMLIIHPYDEQSLKYISLKCSQVKVILLKMVEHDIILFRQICSNYNLCRSIPKVSDCY